MVTKGRLLVRAYYAQMFTALGIESKKEETKE